MSRTGTQKKKQKNLHFWKFFVFLKSFFLRILCFLIRKCSFVDCRTLYYRRVNFDFYRAICTWKVTHPVWRVLHKTHPRNSDISRRNGSLKKPMNKFEFTITLIINKAWNLNHICWQWRSFLLPCRMCVNVIGPDYELFFLHVRKIKQPNQNRTLATLYVNLTRALSCI